MLIVKNELIAIRKSEDTEQTSENCHCTISNFNFVKFTHKIDRCTLFYLQSPVNLKTLHDLT